VILSRSQQRGAITMKFDTNPDRTVDKILADLEEGAREAAGSRLNLVGSVLAPFAALLVKLSRDAAVGTKRIVRLTWALIVCQHSRQQRRWRQPRADLALARETIKIQYAGYWSADEGRRITL